MCYLLASRVLRVKKKRGRNVPIRGVPVPMENEKTEEMGM